MSTAASRIGASARRAQLARVERPALAGLILVMVHVVAVALAGPATSVAGIVALIAAAGAWFALQPRLSRPTRAALAFGFGFLMFAMAGLGDSVPFVTAGPRWDELSGVGATLGGLTLVVAGAAALATPRRGRMSGRRRRALGAIGWLVGAILFAQFVFIPIGVALWTVHAPRLPISGSALGIPHRDVRFETTDGRTIAGWYVPSRNGAAVVMIHGSSGNRTRVAAHARMLARHGYGVLAIDLPGNGQSEGRSNGLGAGAEPAVTAAISFLERRREVDNHRIGGLGLSLGAELLLQAASSDLRLRAVVADGAERDSDDLELGYAGGAGVKAQHLLTLQLVRAVSGTRPPAPLVDSIASIAPRPVLLIASGARHEIDVNRSYRSKIGSSASLWALPAAAHTGGLSLQPRRYEARVVDFFDHALPSGTAASQFAR
jgi:dienelactone hydrolase